VSRYTKSDYKAADRAVAGKQFYDYRGKLEAARRQRWLSMPVNSYTRKTGRPQGVTS